MEKDFDDRRTRPWHFCILLVAIAFVVAACTPSASAIPMTLNVVEDSAVRLGEAASSIDEACGVYVESELMKCEVSSSPSDCIAQAQSHRKSCASFLEAINVLRDSVVDSLPAVRQAYPEIIPILEKIGLLKVKTK